MKNTIVTSVVLFLICAVCAVLCASVNYVTAPRIEENIRMIQDSINNIVNEIMESLSNEGIKL